MKPNSQAHKLKSSHGTEREFGGTLGESQQTKPPSRHHDMHPMSCSRRFTSIYNHELHVPLFENCEC